MKPDRRAVLHRLVQHQASAVGRLVVAPMDGTGRLALDLDGLVWMLRPQRPYHGWGVFEVQPDLTAGLVREADRWEIEVYAAGKWRFKGMVVAAADPSPGRTLVLQPSDGTVSIVRLTRDVDLFDTVEVCFDGRTCWWLDTLPHDPRLDPWRTAFRQGQPPGDALPHRLVGAYLLAQELGRDRTVMATEARIRQALEVAGARLVEMRGLGNDVDVRWSFRDQVYTSRVNPTDLGVVSSGVCLSGRDRDFDLTSLVSVMDEGRRRRMDGDADSGRGGPRRR